MCAAMCAKTSHALWEQLVELPVHLHEALVERAQRYIGNHLAPPLLCMSVVIHLPLMRRKCIARRVQMHLMVKQLKVNAKLAANRYNKNTNFVAHTIRLLTCVD
jgi:hypothetical protein